jgi:hypothetical protein
MARHGLEPKPSAYDQFVDVFLENNLTADTYLIRVGEPRVDGQPIDLGNIIKCEVEFTPIGKDRRCQE